MFFTSCRQCEWAFLGFGFQIPQEVCFNDIAAFVPDMREDIAAAFHF